MTLSSFSKDELLHKSQNEKCVAYLGQEYLKYIFEGSKEASRWSL
jgi:hypothetical protein